MTEESVSGSADASLSAQQWDVEWADPDGSGWVVQKTIRTTGAWSRLNRRLLQSHWEESGEVSGAVVLALRDGPQGVETLLVHQDRVAPAVSLWELPRGKREDVDANPTGTGLRELLEETGLHGVGARHVGDIYADTGALASRTAVVCVRVESPEADPRFSLDDFSEVNRLAWFNVLSLRELIAAGSLRDGISLSALILAHPAWLTVE